MSTRQFPQGQLVMLIKTAGDPAAIAGSARETVKRFDPQVPVGALSPLTSILADQLVARRATTRSSMASPPPASVWRRSGSTDCWRCSSQAACARRAFVSLSDHRRPLKPRGSFASA